MNRYKKILSFIWGLFSVLLVLLALNLILKVAAIEDNATWVYILLIINSMLGLLYRFSTTKSKRPS